MHMAEIVVLGLVVLLSVGAFIIAYFQFREKGFLFNNAYIYASKEERGRMNKKPYYRQSAIAFGAIGMMFGMSALTIITDWNWPFLIIIILSIALIVYAVVSSFVIEKKQG